MLTAAHYIDKELLPQMINGLPLVGHIAHSRRWPPLSDQRPELSMDQLYDRAWHVDIFAAARRGDAAALRHFLRIDSGAVKRCERGSRKSALHIVAEDGHVECCQLLLKAGAPLHDPSFCASVSFLLRLTVMGKPQGHR
eukprot:Skav220539  [mRNA]  locus=scaffold1683:63785:67205:- [translate_table: standard]